MRLIDAAEAERLYERDGAGARGQRRIGGQYRRGTGRASAARRASSARSRRPARRDLRCTTSRSLGVEFLTPPRSDVGATARCLILVTPDAQRTMNTFLGAAQIARQREHRPGGDRRRRDPLSRRLFVGSAGAARRDGSGDRGARAAGRKVAFTLSDTFCVERHRDGFLALIDDGRIDILFANEAEITGAGRGRDFEAAVAAIAATVPTLVVTRSERGAIAIARRRARRSSRRADRAAGRHHRRGRPVRGRVPRGPGARAGASRTRCRLGAIAAAEVIQHYGARPEADLKALAGDLLG